MLTRCILVYSIWTNYSILTLANLFSATGHIEHSRTAMKYDRHPRAVYQAAGKHHRSKKRLPKILIIGVKKGGTRALMEFLRVHPDIRATGPEVHFFDRNYHFGLDWYRYVPRYISYV